MPNSLKWTLLFIVLVSPITYAQSENPWVEIGYQGRDERPDLWASMARVGIVESQFNIGLAYSRGEHGYRQNHQKAFRWLTLAAEESLPPAENNLGVYHALGRGIPVDRSIARFWFKRAFKHDPHRYRLRERRAHSACYFEGWPLAYVFNPYTSRAGTHHGHSGTGHVKTRQIHPPSTPSNRSNNTKGNRKRKA